MVAGVGLVLLVATAAGFFLLAHTAADGAAAALDRTLLRWLTARRAGWLDPVAREVTALGNTATLSVLTLVAAVFFRLLGRRRAAWTMVLALLSSIVANRTLKLLFARPRPDLVFRAVEVLTTSFPSAHAMMSAVVYGTLAHLAGRRTSALLRRACWAFALLLVGSIGTTRVYLGVHYPSDVVAGWLAGIAWTALLVILSTPTAGGVASDAPATRETGKRSGTGEADGAGDPPDPGGAGDPPDPGDPGGRSSS